MSADGNSPYWFLTLFLVVAALFALIPLGLARLWALRFSPPKPGPEKNSTYECGVEPRGPAVIQFRSPYYLFAILFLVFDVEGLFLLPFAVAFKELPVGAVFAMMLFLLLLVEGLAWAWMNGLLRWR